MKCIFYVVKLQNGNMKMLHKHVLLKDLKQTRKEISELDGFIEFSDDNGEYRDIPKPQKNPYRKRK